ncbi:transcription-repair coupling factor [Gordonia araii NBRC 100433]|uniref:Transcription-repair-coupling factor n=1 Tax=Gordonia araii NBRC 100433 TaxID=1073574 RepID=G7H604_9ACTN|nr:transcription-repair coupling factor [Gordonia araii]NNG96960.1 transcription-repair coupling factor [Gordonia araii NBRC 100433]GAB11326.1 transcription-repair coupling factor [Gordonia araii NBRC 100433]
MAPTPVLHGLAQSVCADPTFTGLTAHLEADQLAITAPDAARPFAVAALARTTTDPLLVVSANGREAEDLVTELRELLDDADAVALFPSWETLPHEKLSPSADTVGQRLSVLHRLAEPGGSLRVVVTTVRSLVQPMAPGLGKLSAITLREGDEIDFDGLLTSLVEMAYERVDLVGRRGEFAVRGGILDVFPTTAEHGVRVEFFGDEITDIRAFSVADQRTHPDIDPGPVIIHACRELLLTEPVRRRAAVLLDEQEGGGELSSMLTKLSEGIPVEGMEALMPALVDGELELLTEAIPADSLVLLLDPEKIRTRATDLAATGKEFLDAAWTAAGMGADAPLTKEFSASAYRALDDVAGATIAAGRRWWTLSPLSAGADDEVVLDVAPGPAPRGHEDEIAATFAQLRAHVTDGGRAAIVVAGKGTAARVAERLGEAEVPSTMADDGQAPVADAVTIYHGTLRNGIVCTGSRLVVVTEADLTGTRVAGTRDGRKLGAKRRNQVDPLALTSGDLVVHDQHGIGRFVEMIERTVSGARREYLVLEYAPSKRGQPGDRLYVPMDSLDQLSRYVGGEAPSLSKLGGSDWQNTKRKARKAVREIAGELVQLYAARHAAPGHAFAADTPWQREMEDAFDFTETEDQLTVIAEVKSDMERPVPMDRVIVGDVGYGKTEIAVRAAFKAVQDGKQVAVLVPTTILAQQHLQTFAERMSGFPVTVRGLSRFTDAAQARETIEQMADGQVDIVIGTHRLLQTGVRWKDLGLVIVDEEQRFGVEHKEHIKALRTHVDVLTMSATPIPRTLEMSMAGIREMSTILTPPEERHPVLTYVGAYSTKQVAAAIRRELLRDGQVFYVHNRVSSIDRTAREIGQLVPEARIAVAHGQMNEDQLEATVTGFWNREYDILVCTTIIETGLDIANANTLIVDRAEHFGLSQLHQLRGRVGRSRERGYAYLFYSPDRPLTETAYDRLATIAQNNELGAGMAVALKDLELRGAGNVLGAEQSGHVAGVGFDLYVRLVGEAVQAYRAAADGNPVAAEEAKEVRIDLPVDAHIPVDYVDADRLRLEAYRKLAAAAGDDEVAAVLTELTDRYGPPPTETLRLAEIARLRIRAREFGVTEIGVTGSQVRISPLPLPDSLQVRLKRLYPAATYKPTTSTIALPIPKSGGMGSAPLRDEELIGYLTTLLAQLDRTA